MSKQEAKGGWEMIHQKTVAFMGQPNSVLKSTQLIRFSASDNDDQKRLREQAESDLDNIKPETETKDTKKKKSGAPDYDNGDLKKAGLVVGGITLLGIVAGGLGGLLKAKGKNKKTNRPDNGDKK